MTETQPAPAAPAEFRAAVEQLRAARLRPELRVEEIGAPAGIAPWSFALAADVRPDDLDTVLGAGRLALFHDPAEPEAWQGPFRIVCWAEAPLEPEIGAEPFLAEVAWSWLIDALAAHGAGHAVPSGTATRIVSTGFGELAGQSEGAKIELRASWSPTGPLDAHAQAWGDLLCLLAGLPPTAEAVGLLPRLRAARD